MSEKDLGHPCCSSFLHGGIFVLKSPCRLLAGAATLLSCPAEREHVFALAFWWQISASLLRMKGACCPSRSDVTCPDGGELLLSYSNSLGSGDWGRCLAEGAPCSTLRWSPHPAMPPGPYPVPAWLFTQSFSHPALDLSLETSLVPISTRELPFLPMKPQRDQCSHPRFTACVFWKCRSLGQYEL